MVSDGPSANPKTMFPGIDPGLGRISVRLESGKWVPLGHAGPSVTEPGALKLEASSSVALRSEPLPPEFANRLVALDLRGLAVTADLLRELGPLPALETLILGDTRADDQAIAVVPSFGSLHALDVSGTRITDAGMDLLKELPLKSLIANRTAITNDSALGIAGMKALQVLRLGDTRMDDEGVVRFAGLPELRDFEPPAQTTDAGLAALRDLKRLATLWLARTAITDHAFDPFPESEEIRVVALPEQICDPGLRTLSRFRNLQSLWIESWGFTEWAIEALAGLTRLTDYYFTSPLPDGPAHTLARLHAPRRICLFSPLTTRYTVEVLSESPSIEELRLASKTFSDLDTWLLGRYASLRSVHFIESQLTCRGFRALRESLPNCRVTHNPRPYRLPRRVYQGELLMRTNTEDGSAPWIPVDASLLVVYLPVDSELSYRATSCEVLQELQGLGDEIHGLIVELRLTQCALTEEMAPLLAKMEKLTCLEAPKCGIASREARAVAGLPQLRILNLDLALIGDEEVTILAGCHSLQELHLRGTQMTDASLPALEGLSALKELRINGTHVTTKGVEAFKGARPDVRLFV